MAGHRFTSTDAVQPALSTGRFAGATGTLAVTVQFDPAKSPIEAELRISGTLTLGG